MERWQGKVAVVTGASSGIGAAVAKILISHGVNVVGLARRENKLEELQKEIKDQKGKFHWIKTDLNNENEIISAFNWIESNFKSVDILINNAGVSDKGFVAEGKTEDWITLIKVNVIAVSICTREAIKLMKAHGNDAHIINISSIMAHLDTPMPGHATYAASKRALEALSDGLRGELLADSSKIRITVITPGIVKTEIFELAGIELPPDYPMLSVEDIAETVLFVLKLPQRAQVTEMRIRPLGENLANPK